METIGHSLQNGQKLPSATSKTSTPVKKPQELAADGGKPAGDRRCVGEREGERDRGGEKLRHSCFRKKVFKVVLYEGVFVALQLKVKY